MIEDLIRFIKAAALRVPEKYLKLQTTYEPPGITRERVFCYELYHQLRVQMGDGHAITLNGEIDKRGHPNFKEDHRKNPDFVFHIPGEMEGNTIIMEVKGTLDADIDSDFGKMHTFITDYQYQAGVFLLYNNGMEDLIRSKREVLNNYKDYRSSEHITIITLPVAGYIDRIEKLSDLAL
jgi:hypothetical protein